MNREEFRNKVERLVGTAILKNDKNYTDDFMSLFDAYSTESKPAIEISAKIEALGILIMGAGEYHDDPHEYVIRLSDAKKYRSDLMEFDLSQPIYYDKSTDKNNGLVNSNLIGGMK